MNALESMKNPIQPVGIADDKCLRFKANKIVRHLLDTHKRRDGMGEDLNDLSFQVAQGVFSTDDYQQLMQLIGYSVSGYGDLSTSDPHVCASVDAIEAGTDPRDARILALETTLAMLRGALREPMATLFDVHPSDLEPVK